MDCKRPYDNAAFGPEDVTMAPCFEWQPFGGMFAGSRLFKKELVQ